MPEPLFSIVIPTRNRAGLLKDAMASVLTQDFDDYELIVCDNASVDRTSEVALSSGSPRVRHVRQPEILSMPDNWEAAWKEARGRHVLYLSDDDMLTPGLLRYLAKEALPMGYPLVSWSGALHYHDDSPEEAFRSSLRIPLGAPSLQVERGERLSADLHAFKDHIWYPHLMNCCAERPFFEEIRRTHGRLFFPPAPDYSFMSLAAQELEDWLVSRAPLYVVGRTGSSVGSSFEGRSADGEVQREFLSEFRDDDPLAACPCKAPVVPNYVAATLLNVAEARRSLGRPAAEIDLTAYVYALAYYLGRQRVHIDSFEEHAESLLRLAASRGPDCRRTAGWLVDPPSPAPPAGDAGKRRLFGRGAVRAALRMARSVLADRRAPTAAVPFGGRWMDDQWLGRSILIPLNNLMAESAIDLARQLPLLMKSLEAFSGDSFREQGAAAGDNPVSR